ncbi:MAG: hypothetical protein C5B59_18575 [Bacteroidetes bacterium]|nr:MAG: hypothetical protein C5B59_18575 [Bacteroidota bacterium]
MATQGQSDSLLFNSYNSKSLETLQLFFENWASETRAVSNAEFLELNDTEKNIYEIFQAFYDPKDIPRDGGSAFGNEIYKNAKYLILQDKIEYTLVDSIANLFQDDKAILNNAVLNNRTKGNCDSLVHFRPRLSFTEAKCVFLTGQYDSLLNKFLGNKYSNLGTGSIMSPARAKGESEKRMKFLSKFVKIWYGHWGGYWQLYSYPYATRILIDRDLQNALIDYRMIYEGGYAFMHKTNGKWELVKAKRTWIE